MASSPETRRATQKEKTKDFGLPVVRGASTGNQHSEREATVIKETTVTKKRKWKKLKPYAGTVHHGCLNCGGTHDVAPLTMKIAVGFGEAVVKRDNEIVFDEMDATRKGWGYEKLPTLRKFENMALKYPDHDWRVVLDAPLRSREYQRHGKGSWVLVSSGPGFA